VKPFDLKSALLAKHAQHVVLVHFPIALFLTGVACDFASRWFKRSALAAVAHFNLVAAAISALPVVGSGLLAWQWQLEGQRLKGILLLHLILGCASTLLMWLIVCLRFLRGSHLSIPWREWTYLSLEVLGTVAVILAGHLGGFLSGVNLPGS
jgi:uncharacterized membrane protein